MKQCKHCRRPVVENSGIWRHHPAVGESATHQAEPLLSDIEYEDSGELSPENDGIILTNIEYQKILDRV